MNSDNAVLLVCEERFPRGANSPTVHREYRCPCGCGKVVEESVPGFGEITVWIECAACKNKYSILKGHGHIWELTKK